MKPAEDRSNDEFSFLDGEPDLKQRAQLATALLAKEHQLTAVFAALDQPLEVYLQATDVSFDALDQDANDCVKALRELGNFISRNQTANSDVVAQHCFDI